MNKLYRDAGNTAGRKGICRKEESFWAMKEILSGNVVPVRIAAFSPPCGPRAENVHEIAGVCKSLA